MFNRIIGITCSNCGTKLRSQDRFCTSCGAPQAGQMIACGHCNKEIKADSKFCPFCGESVTAVEAPNIRRNRWSRQDGDLAVRIEGDDLATLTRDVIVNPGTQAIITDNGRTQEVYGPGSYTLDTIGDRIVQFFKLQPKGRRIAIVVDTEAFDLAFDVDGVFTKDPIRVGMGVRVKFEIDNPLKFYLTMLRDRVRYGQADLQAYLQPEIEDVADEWLQSRSVEELAVNLDVKLDLETHLEVVLQRTLAGGGMRFEQLRTLNYHMPHIDKISGVRENYLLQASERDAELEGRKLVFDVFKAEQLHEIAEEAQKVEQFERKSKVRQRMRAAILSDKFDEIRSTQEMETFLRAIDKQKLLDEDEWARFKRTIEWRQDDELRQRKDGLADKEWARAIKIEDRDRDRAHLLARIELESKFELEQLDLLQRMDLEPDQLAFEQEMAQDKMDGEMALEAKRQEFYIQQKSQESEFNREQQNLDDFQRRERAINDTKNRLSIELQQAQNQAELIRIQREQDQADGELGILLLDKMKAVRRKDEEERELIRLRSKERDMELDVQAEQQRLEMRLQLEKAQHEQELAAKAQDQQFELNWMETLKGMAPAELAVTARDAERAQIVRDMQETEAMSGMSEQQILAMMARNSPQAAEALTEIAKAAAEGQLGVEQREMYERLLQQNQQMAELSRAETDRMDKIRKEQAELQKEMMFKALDSQRDASVDIARATSHPPVNPTGPTVVVPGMGGTYSTISGGGVQSGGAMRCPKCSELVAEDANFCPNCQHKLRGGS